MKRSLRFSKFFFGFIFCLFLLGQPLVFAVDGIGGTGSPQDGIGGTGLIDIGFIQRFGSIFVNGTEYELDSNTQYLVDGKVMQAVQLRTGDAVMVSAHSVDGHPYAQQVRIEHAVVGVVEKIDEDARSLSVLGQSIVLAEGAQVQSTQGVLLKLSELHLGDVVGVSALATGTNSWLAFGVHLTEGGAAIKPSEAVQVVLRAKVDNINFTQRTAIVNGVSLQLPTAVLSELRAGEMVRLSGMQQNGQVHFLQAQPLMVLPAVANVHISGLILADGQNLSSSIGAISFASPLSPTQSSLVLVNAIPIHSGLLDAQHVQNQINPMTVNLPSTLQQHPSVTQMQMSSGMSAPSSPHPNTPMPAMKVPMIQMPSFHAPVMRRM